MKNTPLAHNREIVLNALVVDVGIRLEQGHGDLCRANVGSIGDGGHSLGQPPNRPPCSSSSLERLSIVTDDGDELTQMWSDDGR